MTGVDERGGGGQNGELAPRPSSRPSLSPTQIRFRATRERGLMGVAAKRAAASKAKAEKA